MEQGHCVILYDPQSFTALFEKVFLPTGGVCSRKRRVQILQCLIIIKKIFVFFISNLKEGKIKRQLHIISFFSGIVPKYQNFPLITPEIVLKNAKTVRN